ncbi:MAG TPA: BREX system ATP-binding domain-containing protein, partial [Solirubrobacteraceae bacterium]|nr:BREX system ATP-binding domain-containing protein [Solirubrobacteraceae bacterium]
AGVKGEIDHFGALSFLQGLLVVLRDAGHAGLVLVLDEIETLQRVRSDVREKSLNALRQLIDEVDSGQFPGLYVVITGTPAFYDGPQGAQRLAPLAQRLHTDFSGDARFDNPRAVQIRLPNFDFERLVAVGVRVRDIYAEARPNSDRLLNTVNDKYIELLAHGVAGELGGGIGIAPRVFLRKLVDVMDKVDEHADFDPRRDYALTVSDGELTLEEREARRPRTADDVALDV